jgi:hypothetical protein
MSHRRPSRPGAALGQMAPRLDVPDQAFARWTSASVMAGGEPTMSRCCWAPVASATRNPRSRALPAASR